MKGKSHAQGLALGYMQKCISGVGVKLRDNKGTITWALLALLIITECGSAYWHGRKNMPEAEQKTNILCPIFL